MRGKRSPGIRRQDRGTRGRRRRYRVRMTRDRLFRAAPSVFRFAAFQVICRPLRQSHLGAIFDSHTAPVTTRLQVLHPTRSRPHFLGAAPTSTLPAAPAGPRRPPRPGFRLRRTEDRPMPAPPPASRSCRLRQPPEWRRPGRQPSVASVPEPRLHGRACASTAGLTTVLFLHLHRRVKLTTQRRGLPHRTNLPAPAADSRGAITLDVSYDRGQREPVFCISPANTGRSAIPRNGAGELRYAS